MPRIHWSFTMWLCCWSMVVQGTGLFVPPPDMVITCDFWYNPSTIDEPSDPTFGRVVYRSDLRRKVITYDRLCSAFCQADPTTGYNPDQISDGLPCSFYRDLYHPAHPDAVHKLVWGWDGVSESGPVEIEVFEDLYCGKGVITRTFYLRTSQGRVPCGSQRIYVVNCAPFYINESVCTDPNDDIIWPNNCVQPPVLTECNPDISPENPLLGRPRLRPGINRRCNMVAINHHDTYITVVPRACFKVIRTWHVVDWCRYDPTNPLSEGVWTFRQVIKVHNRVAPTFRWKLLDINVGDTMVSALYSDTQRLCANKVVMQIEASDDCTPTHLLHTGYAIDLYNDGKGPYGSYDLFVGEHFASKGGPAHDNPYAYRIDPYDASGAYPLGKHRWIWKVEDGCGNSTVIDTVFEIRDTKPPTPYCRPGIVTVVMPASGMVDIDAAQLVLKKEDNCSATTDLHVYFDPNTEESIRTLSCADLPPNAPEALLPIDVWVVDEVGNAAVCRTAVILQDPNGVCFDSTATRTVTLDLSRFPLRHFDAITLRIEDTASHEEFYRSTVSLRQMLTVRFNAVEMRDAYTALLRSYTGYYPRNWYQLSDLFRLYFHVAGFQPFRTAREYLVADINEDGLITMEDVGILGNIFMQQPDVQYLRDPWIEVPIDAAETLQKAVTPQDAPLFLRQYFGGLLAKYFDDTLHAVFLAKGDIVTGTPVYRSGSTLSVEIEQSEEDGATVVSFTPSTPTALIGYHLKWRGPSGRWEAHPSSKWILLNNCKGDICEMILLTKVVPAPRTIVLIHHRRNPSINTPLLQEAEGIDEDFSITPLNISSHPAKARIVYRGNGDFLVLSLVPTWVKSWHWNLYRLDGRRVQGGLLTPSEDGMGFIRISHPMPPALYYFHFEGEGYEIVVPVTVFD